jgi:ribosomal protein S18 acetylase RimI-like enzyme
MIKLIPVSNSLELNDDLEQIYTDSFPADERREWQQIKELLHHPNFSLNQVFGDGNLIGLISFWNLPGFIFIEHFAILESARGKGFGTQVVKQVIEEKSTKVVVEVEEPITESARRRIDFYRRFGFSICEGIYYQPPYSSDKNKVKMLLMSFPNRLTPSDFETIKILIYRNVYNYS